MNSRGANVVRTEAEALRQLAERIAGPMAGAFCRAVELLAGCGGRVVVTGMGKSGLIARKIAATLSSTGTPSLYLHPAEARHGDLGMLVRGDAVIALSASGETGEILELLPTIKRLGIALISFTCDALYPPGGAPSSLAQAANIALDCSVAKEACSLGLAPTSSTTAMLALGDAIAVALSEKRGFKEGDFADLHPGGKIGKKLTRVAALMHTGDAVPRVAPATRMADVIFEMSSKKLGMTTVVENGVLAGVISDGDLRRLLQSRGKDILDLAAGECMTRTPKTISAHELATAALEIMEQKKITSLVVVDSAGRVEGVLHLHDLWGTQMV
ncbi:MAG: KpsF/GutQ family sugar-phosphate isomerase [Candidatus Korobacteraceae bacterium]|jgi:arabinose-5-phosphate isomerase